MLASRIAPSRTRFVQRLLVLALLVPTATSAQGTRLNGPFPRPGSGDVDSMRVSPDGARVVYLASLYALNGNTRKELFSVPLDGSAAAVRLNAQLPTGSTVAQFQLNSTGSRVVYIADQNVKEIGRAHV